MTSGDIKWIKQALVDNKQDHIEMLRQVKATNGIVGRHTEEIARLSQKQRDHFYFHRYKLNLSKHIEKMSRAQATVVVAALQIVAMVIIALVVR